MNKLLVNFKPGTNQDTLKFLQFIEFLRKYKKYDLNHADKWQNIENLFKNDKIS